jgi:uncharacterized protein YciI
MIGKARSWPGYWVWEEEEWLVGTFVALLEFTEDAELRNETRPAHREYLRSLLEAGKLRLSGPWADDTGACIVYQAASADEAQALLDADPYRTKGVLADAQINEWKIVMQAGG